MLKAYGLSKLCDRLTPGTISLGAWRCRESSTLRTMRMAQPEMAGVRLCIRFSFWQVKVRKGGRILLALDGLRSADDENGPKNKKP